MCIFVVCRYVTLLQGVCNYEFFLCVCKFAPYLCEFMCTQSQVFDVVVVDEAAQALEAATWAGLLKASRAVLAGV